jgi:dipeptidyl aminopeptidase/acylaminoacyl peptidase
MTDETTTGGAGRDKMIRWTKRASYTALGLVGSYVTFCVGLAYPLSSRLIRPRKKRIPQLESKHLRRFLAERGLAFEEVSFRSFDGTRLDGWWFDAGRDRPTVIALHGVSKNRTDMVRFAIALGAAGINVLLFDGRGHGKSEGRFVTYGFYEKRDVEAAIDFAVADKGVSDLRIGLAGISMGAAITLQVAAANRRVRAIWTDSPFASLSRVSMDRLRTWTRLPSGALHPVMWVAMKVAERRGQFEVRAVDPLALAERISCPVYLIHGDRDALIGVEHSRHIFDALASAEKHLWVIPGVAHGRGFRRVTAEYADRLVGFFSHAFEAE